MASLTTKREFGQTETVEGLQVVPSALTALTSTDTIIFQITVSNTTASAVTFTVQDQQSSPLQLMASTPIQANQVVCIPFPEGVKMIGGIKWQAGSANALNSEILGFKL